MNFSQSNPHSERYFSHDALNRAAVRVSAFAAWRGMAWALLVLGLARGIVALLAYPPALVQDSFVYLFYGQRLGGSEIIGLGEIVPPLYPLLLLVTDGWFGSLWLQIGVQWVMSAAIVPLYYLALRPYNALLGLALALVVAFDFQTATTFSFIATEPLYIFLLALSFMLLLRGGEPDGRLIGMGLAGASAVLLLLTRAVARFLILPFVVLFALKTRSPRKTLALLGGYAGALLLSALVVLPGTGAGSAGSSDYMLLGVLLNQPEWVSAAHGANSAEYLALIADCDDLPQRCYEARNGTLSGLGGLVMGTALETIRARPLDFLLLMLRDVDNFLSLSAQQLDAAAPTPAAAQCAGLAEAAALTPTGARYFSWSWSMETYIAENFDDFKARYLAMRAALCPVVAESAAVRSVIDGLMFRYRSLGRPDPYLWYGAALLLTLIIPRARRYWLPLLLALAILLNHALISAALSNIQPRYVLVTNPFRALPLLLLVLIVLECVLRLLDRLMVRRRTKEDYHEPLA